MQEVLISTVYSGDAIKFLIKERAIPTKIYLLVEKKDMPAEKKKAIEDLKNKLSDFSEIILEKCEILNLYNVAKHTVKIIDKEYENKNLINLHISEGRKILALGVLFAANIRSNKIKNIYYVAKSQLVTLPKLVIKVSNTKRKLLSVIQKKLNTIDQIEKKLKLPRPTIYAYAKELTEDGFLEGKNGSFKITDMGRIAIL